ALFGHLLMTGLARELIGDIAVPFEPQPAQALENRLDSGLGGALPVRMFYAEQTLAIMPARIGPTEKSRPSAADMQISCGRGRKPGDDLLVFRHDLPRSGPFRPSMWAHAKKAQTDRQHDFLLASFDPKAPDSGRRGRCGVPISST